MNIYDVFVSYRRSDGSELAEKVASALRERGLSVFFDTEEILHGEDFTRRIEGALRQAPNYLLIATPDVFRFRTQEKDWVLEEMCIACENYAGDLDKRRTFTLVAPQYVYRTDASGSRVREAAELPRPEAWPHDVFDLSRSNRIMLRGDLPTDREYREILTAVTRVTHHNMWNAGRRWLEENRKAGRRFASLDISRSLFPHASRADASAPEDEEDNDFPSMVQQQPAPSASPEGEKLPLFDALAQSEDHVYLVGEGGIGKTTSLIHVMERAYQNRDYAENAQIPLFVELSKAPDTAGRLYANGRSTFIRRAIYRQIRLDRTVKQVTEAEAGALDAAFTADPKAAVTPIDALLSNEVSPPQYLLLLDGLNEVSRTPIRIPPTDEDGRIIPGETQSHTVYDMIVAEINLLMRTCPNVRIILTGRADDATVTGKHITRWQLTGIDEPAMRAFLLERMPEDEAEAVLEDRQLRDTLRIPLFLTMYIRLRAKAGISTQGEILHAFFTEKGKLLGDYTLPYTLRNRAGEVESELDHSAAGRPRNRLTARMQFFIIDFLLAALGRHMERNNLFSIKARDVEAVICPILTDEAPTAVCGIYGQEAFPRYKVKGTRQSTAAEAELLRELLGTGMDAAENFCLLCTNVLGILVDVGQYDYAFIHQHVRDYFAALDVMNTLWIGAVCTLRDGDAAHACLTDALGGEPLSYTVRRILGEALGEHRNRPQCDERGQWHYAVPPRGMSCPRNLLSRSLDTFRGRFGQRGYALWNLMQILKESRGDLSGEDLSRLDLTRIRLNRYPLGRAGCAAKLEGALVTRKVFMPSGHTRAVRSAQYSPDGKRIVTASDDGTARVWDSATMTEIGVLEGHTGVVTSAVFRPTDGRKIITASADGTMMVWDAETFECLNRLEEWAGKMTFVRAAAYSPDGRRITLAEWPSNVSVWDADALEKLTAFRVDTNEGNYLNSIAYSPDGKRLITATKDGFIKVYETEHYREVKVMEDRSGDLYEAVYSPDGRWIISVPMHGPVKIWDARTYGELGTLDSAQFVLFSPDGRRIQTITPEMVRVWDAESFRETERISNWQDNSVRYMNAAALSPDGRWIVTATDDCDAVIWDAATLRYVGILSGNRGGRSDPVYSPDGRHIATVEGDRHVVIRDTATYRKLGTLDTHSRYSTKALYSPDGRCILTIERGKAIMVWDAATFRELASLPFPPKGLSAASFSWDGKRIVARSYHDGVPDKAWDAATLMETELQEEDVQLPYTVARSPDGRKILVAPKGEPPQVWDTVTLTQVGILHGYPDSVKSASFSPDGKRIVTALGLFIDILRSISEEENRLAVVWDVEHCCELAALACYEVGVLFCVAFSPDGNCILTAYGDGSVKVWNAQTYTELATLCGHTKYVFAAHYSPDNRHILTASADGTIRIWDAQTYECLHVIRNVPGLEVTGCDLTKLHEASRLSEEDKQLLWAYGAQV